MDVITLHRLTIFQYLCSKCLAHINLFVSLDNPMSGQSYYVYFTEKTDKQKYSNLPKVIGQSQCQYWHLN